MTAYFGDLDKNDEGQPLQRLARGAFWLILASSALLIALRALNLFEIGVLWDDAYIFQRYAHNLMTEHQLAWNPGGSPTYGLTSLAFLLIVVPAQLVAGGNWALGAALSSSFCGVLFVALLLWMMGRSAPAGAARALGAALVISCVASSATPDHFASGMDTTFALAYLSGALLVALAYERSSTRRNALALGVVAGLAFVVRPDLLLVTLAVPLSHTVFAKDAPTRRRSALGLAVGLGTVLTLMALTHGMFGTALPLPGYTKVPGFYGEGFDEIYRGRALEAFLSFFEAYWPLFLLILVDTVLQGKRALRELPALDRGLLVALLLFVAYHLFGTLPIMSYSQRFYQPLVPLLALLTVRGVERLWKRILPSLGADKPGRFSAVFALALAVVLFSSLAPAISATGRSLTAGVSSGRTFGFDLERAARSGPIPKNWYRVAALKSLPSEVTIATTEIGALGAVLPDHRIYDLAGLTAPDFALAPFDPNVLFDKYKPDIIYLPHPDYREMNQKLKAAPQFADYDVYSKAELGTTAFGMAIWRQSPHYGRLTALMPKSTPAAPAITKAAIR